MLPDRSINVSWTVLPSRRLRNSRIGLLVKLHILSLFFVPFLFLLHTKFSIILFHNSFRNLSMVFRYSRKLEKRERILTFPRLSLGAHSIELPMSLFPSHRDIFIIPPNMPNIIIRRITNKETNPLKAIQRFLKLPIKDNAEYSVGRKRFLATRLLSFSTE